MSARTVASRRGKWPSQARRVRQEEESLTYFATLVWLGNLLCDTTGQLAFKAASERAGDLDGVRRWRAMLSSPALWLGIGAFVIEPLLWLWFLSLMPLAEAVMLGSVNIVGVMIGGHLLFGEELNHRRLTAIVLISVGVAMVGWGAT
jgi:drug/metabolite transporter (DMT)-like permease